MEVNAEQFELLRMYLNTVSFLLRMYAADVVVGEAYTDLVTFQQKSNIMDETRSSLP